MLRKYPAFLLLALCASFSACKKPIQTVLDSDICLRNSTVYYQKKWAAVYTRIENNEVPGVKKTFIVPANGYFSVNFNATYKLFGDPEPTSGKWSIDKDCNFVLTPTAGLSHKYAVRKLTADSLVISETVGAVTSTMHYATYACHDMNNLIYQWDNVATYTVKYNATGATDRQANYPTGFIKFNADAGYNLTSNSIALKGTWGIAQPDCNLVLDKNKAWEKSYIIEKLTADSLKLWYKDTVSKTNYLLLYKKHL